VSDKEEALRHHREQLQEAKNRRASVRTQAKIDAQRETFAIRTYIEDEVGKHPWIEHVYQCICRAIIRDNVARVDAGFFSGQVEALFGAVKPNVGAKYELRWPSKGALPWIKVPRNPRWLYGNKDTILWRWEWPPPTLNAEPGVVWEGERVRAMGDKGFLGSSTPTSEDTQIVLESTTRVPEEGGAEFFGMTNNGRLHHYEDMGFGQEVHTYSANPEFLIIQEIANDGITTGTVNGKYSLISVPLESGYIPVDYTTHHTECCLHEWPFRTCANKDNYEPVWGPGYLGPPFHLSYDIDGQRLWLGQRGGMQVFQFLEEGGTVYLDRTEHYTEILPWCDCGGCFYWGVFVFWEHCDCYQRVWTSPPWNVYSIKYTKPHYDQIQCHRTWEYEGKPRAVYSYMEYLHRVHINEFSSVIRNGSEPLQVVAPGCVPSRVSIPRIGHEIPYIIGAALDPTDMGLILWVVRDFQDRAVVYRWVKGTMKHIEDIGSDLDFAVSRDGTDILAGASPETRALIYSTDGGDEWAPCAPMVPSGADNFKFVDQIA
jgi:hypothetical protein